MSKIVTTDVATDPLNPASGTHAIYTKPGVPGVGGVFVKDSAGNVVGPFGAGGGSGITQLTSDVTAGPGSGSQVATIAPLAVTTGKIAAKAVDLSKLADPGGGAFSFIWADTPTTWKAELIERLKFGTASRISILGDVGGLTDPQNPRIVNSVGPDVDLGYLARTQRSAFPTGSGSPPGLPLDNGFTFYEISLNFTSWYLLPDCRSYPPGSEIVLVNESSSGSGLDAIINETGGGDPFRAIVGPSLATGAPQIIGDDYRGRRFLTNGSGGWILIGAF
jgi:hypothetical protein